MAKYIYLEKDSLNRLCASDLDSEEAIGKLKENQVYKVKISKAIESKFYAKFQVMLNMAFENQSKYETKEQFLYEVKLRCGHFTEHVTLKGKTVYIPRSFSPSEFGKSEFNETQEEHFRRIYNKAIDVILKYFIDPDNEMIVNVLVRF